MATILFDGVAYGMLLFVLACGLAVTLGLMNFVNLAHGAFAMAGMTPADVEVLTVYDPFTIVTLMQIEDIGFCKKGEGGPFVETDSLAYNTHGGLLSHAYVLGIAHVVEVVRKLRGAAEVGVYGGYTGPQASCLVMRAA